MLRKVIYRPTIMASPIRIQKYLSELDMCSRREAERWLIAGRIRINGKIVTELGTMIDPDRDQLSIETPEKATPVYKYIAFHKPVGIVSNLPTKGERDIRNLLPAEYSKLHTIGRLDKDSEGLILLTDDGVFAKHALAAQHEREYVVTVSGEFTGGMAERIEEGVTIFGKKTKRSMIEMLESNRFIIRMNEGKNRQIRRMITKLGLAVIRLIRVRYGQIPLSHLEPGHYRNLAQYEIDGIRNPEKANSGASRRSRYRRK